MSYGKRPESLATDLQLANADESQVLKEQELQVEVADAELSLSQTVRALLWTVYVPTCLLSLGNSFTFPTLPVYMRRLGLDGLSLGLCMAGMSLGRIFTNMISGFIQTRYGVRFTMVLSFSVLAVGAFVNSQSMGFLSLFSGLFVNGFGQSLEAIGRQSYSKRIVANKYRGRTIAILGGTTRFGAIVGPAVGGVMAQVYNLRTPFILQIVIFICSAGVCFAAFRPVACSLEAAEKYSENPAKDLAAVSYSEVWQRHRHSLIVVGVAMFFLMFLREARVLLVPLYGDDMHMGSDTIGVAVSCGWLVDSILFPLAGHLSDTYGRKRTGVPSFALLSIGMFWLATSSSFFGLVLSSILIGFGNGFSSGLVMTTGGDVAPPHPATGLFLGLYAGFYDSGPLLAPVLIGLTAHAVNFRVAGFLVSALGLLGTTWYVGLTPETHGKQVAEVQDEEHQPDDSLASECGQVELEEVIGKAEDT